MESHTARLPQHRPVKFSSLTLHIAATICYITPHPPKENGKKETYLNTLGGVNNNVWTTAFWAECPDLTCFTDVPFVLIGEVPTTDLWIILGSDLVVVHFLGELFAEWGSLHVKTVVLVWRLGEAHTVGLGLDAFSEGDDWVGLSEWNTGVVFFEILEANLKVEFAGTSDNVLTRFFHGDLDHRICCARAQDLGHQNRSRRKPNEAKSKQVC